ncbi:Sulfate transporter CysZ [Choanephora cucurbitarum]|uniref:Sulfate transporter CysZ n=1 Tax=Choanephora cucurbitarum TaxID=101091 RepID=A0A1C7N6F9_9FUNG|nr:Sulfate transporter CysZ [Choanephora cucurbitarum]
MAPPSTYPVAGLVYFMTHPQLWGKAICPFFLTLIVGIISLVLSFVYLLPLQAHALIIARCPVWLAWTVSVIFVLLESAIFDLLFYAIVLPFFQDALFDATLRARGLDRMFVTRIPVSGLILCCRGVSSGLALVWLLLLAQVVILILTAPLHLIPVVGTAVACYINGWVACWGHHLHYDLEFRGFSVGDSRSYAWRHKADYCQFGAVAVALELVPFFNLIFMWTNVVGAALWVGDKYEKNEREIAKRQQRTHSASNEIVISPYGGPKDGYGSIYLQ